MKKSFFSQHNQGKEQRLYRHNSIYRTTDQLHQSQDINSAIYRFHHALSTNDLGSTTAPEAPRCFVMEAAWAVLDTLKKGTYSSGNDYFLPASFYTSLTVDLYRSAFRPMDADQDMIEIFLKQLLHIMREAGLVFSSDKRILSDEGISEISLYSQLIETFWNSMDWQEIFTSSPEHAADLQETRSLFIDLLLQTRPETQVDDFIRNFFSMSGFAAASDLFSLSFVDFYLINWLHNFGIIELIQNDPASPVLFSLTPFADTFLARFSLTK